MLMPDPSFDPVRAFCYVSREEGTDDAEAAVRPLPESLGVGCVLVVCGKCMGRVYVVCM